MDFDGVAAGETDVGPSFSPFNFGYYVRNRHLFTVFPLGGAETSSANETSSNDVNYEVCILCVAISR